MEELQLRLLEKLHTCVVDALNVMPMTEQIPSPAATDKATISTPAIPTPACDWIASVHCISDIHAYTTYNITHSN